VESLVTNTALGGNDPIWYAAKLPLNPRFEDHPFFVGVTKTIIEADRTAVSSCIVESFDKYVVVVRVDKVNNRTA
jgi:hypothetical protein